MVCQVILLRNVCKYNEHKLPCTQDVLPLCVVKFSSYYLYCKCNCSTVTCPDLRPNLHYFHCCWLFGVQRFQVFVWGENPISICLSLSFWPFTRQCEVLATSKLKMKLLCFILYNCFLVICQIISFKNLLVLSLFTWLKG